jgi:hypothetical protein
VASPVLVLLEIPNPVFEEEFNGDLKYTPVPVLRSCARSGPPCEKPCALLLAAKTAAALGGQGVHYADASARLATLAELIPAPVGLHQSRQECDCREPSTGAWRLHAFAAPKMYVDFSRAPIWFSLSAQASLRRPFGPAVAERQDHYPRHQRCRRHQQGLCVRSRSWWAIAALVLDAVIAEVERQKTTRDTGRFAALKEEIAAAKRAWLAEWAKHLDSNEVPINQYG